MPRKQTADLFDEPENGQAAPTKENVSEMIPRTLHGLDAFECLSSMQKCVRRGMEREAMEFAVELMHTSKAFHTMVINRLLIISHEDIDTMFDPSVVPFVATACAQAKEWYNADVMKLGKARMAIGNAIRLMCRSQKSREGDHFHVAIGLANLLEDKAPEIPDWALCQHTRRGRKKGRGLEHFREVGAKLTPEPDPDPYEDEAYRLWALRKERGI